jgi:coniferyl-aldehyde dehydrogenase
MTSSASEKMPFSATEPAQMKAIFTGQQAAYAACPMPALEERKQHLNSLRKVLIEYREAIVAAIDGDFAGRSRDETMLSEIIPGIQCIDYTLKHLRRWMKPEKRKVALHFLPASARVVYQPLGVIGIIVPFNYPVGLAIVPLITALAAGNRAMIKMSESTPRTADLLREMLHKCFREDHVAVITGEADIAAAFSGLDFDHLLFTGSTGIGKLVMREAAGNLTPVTLELGGKSPAIIADDIPLADIIDRICFAKAFNSGQTCVAPDYILVPRAKQELFVELYKTAFNRMYPTIDNNPDYTSIVHAHSLQRLQDSLKDATDKGAKIDRVCDETDNGDGSLRMPLCLVTNVTDTMRIMQHELFGPILPVIPYDHINEAINYVNQHPRPLSLYLFSHDRALQERVTNRTHSGSICINDAMIQFGVDDLPFGGIGLSGMGRYHGREGFLTLSHAKPVLRKGKFSLMHLIYPPYGTLVQKWLIKWLSR